MSDVSYVHGLALRSTAKGQYTFKVLDPEIVPKGKDLVISLLQGENGGFHEIVSGAGVAGKEFAVSGIISSLLKKYNIDKVKIAYFENDGKLVINVEDAKSSKETGMQEPKVSEEPSKEQLPFDYKEGVRKLIEREPIVASKRKAPELKPQKVVETEEKASTPALEKKALLTPMSIEGTNFKYLSYHSEVLPEGYDKGDLTLTMVSSDKFRLVVMEDGQVKTSGEDFSFGISDVITDTFSDLLASLPMDGVVVNIDAVIDGDLRLPIITFQALISAPEVPQTDLDDVEEEFPVVEEEVIPESDTVEEVPALEERPRHFVEVAGENEVTVATDDIIPEAVLLPSIAGYPEEEESVTVVDTHHPETNVVLEEGLDAPEGYDISKTIDPNSIMIDGVFLSDMSFEDLVKVLMGGVTIEDVDSGFSATVEWDETDEDVSSEGDFHTGGSLSETGVSLATPVDVKILDDTLLDYGLPKYATSGSAGLDLRIISIDEPYVLQPGEVLKAGTGIAVHLESPMMVGKVYPRSGLSSKHGIALANTVGIIDSDYQGEILVMLKNFSDEPYTLNPGDRVAQMVVTIVDQVDFNVVTEFSNETERGDGALGSTGSN